MTSATGLGPAEVETLEALDSLRAVRFVKTFVKSMRIVELVHSSTRLSPRHVYETLCTLSRRDVCHLVLIDFHGNAGTNDFSAAAPSYTETSINDLGTSAVASERGEVGSLPIGLINGNVHQDGWQPPFAPVRVVKALRVAASGGDDDDIIAAVGPPAFATECRVDVDFAALAAGAETMADLRARVQVESETILTVSHLPPRSSITQIATILADGARHFGIDDIADEGMSLRLELRAGSDVNATARGLEEVWGVRDVVRLRLDRPLAALLREWVARDDPSTLQTRLSIIERSLGTQTSGSA